MVQMHQWRKRKLISKKKSIKKGINCSLKINQVFYLLKIGPFVTYEVFLKWKEDRRIRKEA
jgi:hypothetical protein